jgi:hypothetical protein
VRVSFEWFRCDVLRKISCLVGGLLVACIGLRGMGKVGAAIPSIELKVENKSDTEAKGTCQGLAQAEIIELSEMEVLEKV